MIVEEKVLITEEVIAYIFEGIGIDMVQGGMLK